MLSVLLLVASCVLAICSAISQLGASRPLLWIRLGSAFGTNLFWTMSFRMERLPITVIGV